MCSFQLIWHRDAQECSSAIRGLLGLEPLIAALIPDYWIRQLKIVAMGERICRTLIYWRP